MHLTPESGSTSQLLPKKVPFTQPAHGSFGLFGMHLTPESGSTSQLALALWHKVESGSLSHGPSSHILSIFTLSISTQVPACTSARKLASPPGHENELSV